MLVAQCATESVVLPGILAAAADPEGGKWVLVIGAGSSVEPPTNLPTGAQCSHEAHRRLRADGILTVDCANPSDLSEVADAVFAATNGQDEIVQRLPRTRFRAATPNSGHLIAAALLVEHSLACVVTLNFDLAMNAALAAVGSAESVAVIAGPDDIPQLGNVNLVYLHRNALAPANEWVLRSTFLDTVWNDRWEAVMATRILVAPTVVFAGLGSPAAALTETVRLIRQALPADTVRVYQVDLAPFGTLSFTTTLRVAEAEYVVAGWCDFMAAIAERVLSEHWFRFAAACVIVVAENGYAANNLQPVADGCRRLGLVGFGLARARWLLHDGPYARVALVDTRIIADVLLAMSFVAAGIGGTVSVRDDGAMELRDGARLLAAVGFATGGGVRSLVAVEAALATQRKYWPWKETRPRRVVVTGHLPSVAPTAPISIVAEVDENGIVDAGTSSQVISAYALRAAPARLAELAN